MTGSSTARLPDRRRHQLFHRHLSPLGSSTSPCWFAVVISAPCSAVPYSRDHDCLGRTVAARSGRGRRAVTGGVVSQPRGGSARPSPVHADWGFRFGVPAVIRPVIVRFSAAAGDRVPAPAGARRSTESRLVRQRSASRDIAEHGTPGRSRGDAELPNVGFRKVGSSIASARRQKRSVAPGQCHAGSERVHVEQNGRGGRRRTGDGPIVVATNPGNGSGTVSTKREPVVGLRSLEVDFCHRKFRLGSRGS